MDDVDKTVASSEKRRVIKNVLAVGVAFMVHFTAFHGAANLQSSVNAKHSGTYTLAAIYGSLIFSNLFLPVLVIRLDSVSNITPCYYLLRYPVSSI